VTVRQDFSFFFDFAVGIIVSFESRGAMEEGNQVQRAITTEQMEQVTTAQAIPS
jgi:hypothetical protein